MQRQQFEGVSDGKLKEIINIKKKLKTGKEKIPDYFFYVLKNIL